MKDSVKDYVEFANGLTEAVSKHGQKALDQCIAPFVDKTSVKLRVNRVTKFSEKGRPDHVQELVDFPCVVTPNRTTSRSSSAGGERSRTEFTIIVTPPTTEFTIIVTPP